MILVDGFTFTSRTLLLAFSVVLGGSIESKGKNPSPPVLTPTYHGEIAPILRAKCWECHRSGQVAPFALETYDQARKRAGDLAQVVETHRMPPWKPSSGFGPKLKHERSLSVSEIRMIRAWADSGAPRGVEAARPQEPAADNGWKLGTPDLVLEPASDFQVASSGPDLYRCFVIPTRLTRDVYVSAVEYRPGNPRVVHHLMAFIEIAGLGRARDQEDTEPGYSSYSGAGVEIFGDLGGWAPGNEPSHLPDGIGRSLPKGADVILQVHYHPDGKPESDRTRIGLYFSKKPVKQTLQWKGVMNQNFQLEAGQNDTKVKASWMVPVDVEVLAVAPHMHQLGRQMTMTARFPDGRKLNLIQITDWDPGWQVTYEFDQPIALPRGTVVHVEGHFDNSAHPRNPNHPPKRVRWGPNSTDEMCVGYLAVVKARQDLTQPGEKDDLFSMLVDQCERIWRRDQNASKRR
jgi:hypothetical protein